MKCNILILSDAVEFVQDVLQKIEDSIDVQNIDSLIQRAEAILRTIQLRDFSENNETAGNEKTAAQECKLHVSSYLEIHLSHI